MPTRKHKKGAFGKGNEGYGLRHADADAANEPDAGARANECPPVALAHAHTHDTHTRHTSHDTHTATATATHTRTRAARLWPADGGESMEPDHSQQALTHALPCT